MHNHDRKHKRDRKHRQRRREKTEIRGPGIRHVRIAEIIRKEIHSVLNDEIADPVLQGLVVTTIELSVDGRSARIWITPATPGHDTRVILEALQRARGFFRNRLAESLFIKRVPEIQFRADDRFTGHST